MPLRRYFITVAFVIALAIFAFVGWLAYRNISSVRESDYWENHTHEVIAEFDALLFRIIDAQNAERGYLITGDPAYLDPYNNSLARLPKVRAALRTLTKDNPAQQRRLDSLDALIEKKLGELRETIQARNLDTYTVVSRMVREHLSKNTLDAIRVSVSQAQEQERVLLQQRKAKKQADLARALRAFQLGSVSGFAILLAVFYLLNREIAQRTGAEAQLLSRNEELQEARDRERSQNWIRNGLNDLNVEVRGDRPLEEMTAQALARLCRYLKAGVGAIYLFDERTETLRARASYAFAADRLHRSIALGEGLAGQAARERRAVSLSEVPPEYLPIASALGEAPPRAVLALPLMHDGRLVGVLELGSFREFREVELDFLDQAAEILAIAIGVNVTRQRVNELLQQSQSQEEELRVQQEELQQSNEELGERAQLLERQRGQIESKNLDLERTGRELMEKARELERASGYKSEFLANVSHELRTPLNSLMILSGLLQENREGNLTPKQVEYAGSIKSAGQQLLTLISDILDISKVEAGRIEYFYQRTSLSELCRQLEELFRPMAEQKGLGFTVAVEEGVGEELSLDSQRTLQVLKNLVSNALKFTSLGEVALRVRPARPAENPLTAPAVAFEVWDSGIGIPPEKQHLVFQAFQQADGSVSRKYGGTGLGLSISRQLALGMGGEILLSSEEGKGSVFTLYLPASREVSTSDAAAPPPAEQPAAPVSTPPAVADDRDRLAAGKRCILVVEDDPTFARLLVEKVRERGFAAILASDGGSGIELARKYQPSAILLDVLLPGVDGWSVMQKLTEDAQIRHIPVHFISCLDEKQKALSMGAIGFVLKPVTPQQLEGVLGSVEEAISRTLRKLLIVEDDQAEAQALVALLQERGIAITVARSGGEAIGLLSSDPVDCIVLDLGLADMSGYDLLEHIRGLDESRRVPVIIHTGQELSLEDTQRLQHYAQSIVIKGARSPERLLNEVTLFLHVMESRLPKEKQRMIRNSTDRDSVLAESKVLLVDDDMRNVFSLSSVLAERGMQVVEAENGKVALERLEEHPDVDLVLMDVMMPEMDGYEATRLIRNDPRFARLPIIALTAKAMKGDREECLKAGASDYINKPVDVDRLLSLLRVWLYNKG